MKKIIKATVNMEFTSCHECPFIDERINTNFCNLLEKTIETDTKTEIHHRCPLLLQDMTLIKHPAIKSFMILR